MAWPGEPREKCVCERVLEISSLNVGTCLEIYENGFECGRGESPQAHIRRGRSYGLYEASGSPPEPIWGGFKQVLAGFRSKPKIIGNLRILTHVPNNVPNESFPNSVR